MLSKNTYQNKDFIVGNCPGCEKYLRVPTHANPSAIVKCPLCSESFPLAVLIEDVVPSVEIVADQPVIAKSSSSSRKSINAIDTPDLFHVKSTQVYEPITEKKNGRFVVPQQLAKGTKKKKRRRRSSSSSGNSGNGNSAAFTPKTSTAPSINPDDLTSKMSAVAEQAIQRKSSSDQSESNGPSRKSKRSGSSTRSRSSKMPATVFDRGRNAIVELMIIAVAVFFAVPVLQVLVWWLFGADPLGLAPSVSKVAPLIVPITLTEIDDQENNRTALAENNNGKPRIKIVNLNENVIPQPLPTPNLDPDFVHVDKYDD